MKNPSEELDDIYDGILWLTRGLFALMIVVILVFGAWSYPQYILHGTGVVLLCCCIGWIAKTWEISMSQKISFWELFRHDMSLPTMSAILKRLL